jgi:hypothetical protein
MTQTISLKWHMTRKLGVVLAFAFVLGFIFAFILLSMLGCAKTDPSLYDVAKPGSISKQTSQQRLLGSTLKYTDAAWSRQGPDGLLYFNANDNAAEYATWFLWPIAPGGDVRAPCGGKAECPNPNADEATCVVTVTDCKFEDAAGKPVEPRVLRTVSLKCSGLQNCWHDKGVPDRCCREIL